MRRKIIIFILGLILLANIVAAQTDVYLFYGQGCPHCAKVDSWLTELETENPDLNVVRKEVYFNDENREIFEEMASAYDTTIAGVPMMFTTEKVYVGADPDFINHVEKLLKECGSDDCTINLEEIKNGENNVYNPQTNYTGLMIAVLLLSSIIGLIIFALKKPKKRK